jgi:hypothetical protein
LKGKNIQSSGERILTEDMETLQTLEDSTKAGVEPAGDEGRYRRTGRRNQKFFMFTAYLFLVVSADAVAN